MPQVIVGILCFVAGFVVCWLYKSAVQAKIQQELNALKASATNAINKL